MAKSRIAFQLFAAFIISAWSIYAAAGDSMLERRNAAARYLEAVSVEKLMNDSLAGMTKQMPVDQRYEVVKYVKRIIDVAYMEDIMLYGLVKVYTVEELNALADFYGSDIGKQVMQKFSAFMGETMPILQHEVAKAAHQIVAEHKDQE